MPFMLQYVVCVCEAWNTEDSKEKNGYRFYYCLTFSLKKKKIVIELHPHQIGKREMYKLQQRQIMLNQ